MDESKSLVKNDIQNNSNSSRKMPKILNDTNSLNKQFKNDSKIDET